MTTKLKSIFYRIKNLNKEIRNELVTLKAERDALKKLVEAKNDALGECAAIFTYYYELHMSKSPPDLGKAEANRIYARNATLFKNTATVSQDHQAQIWANEQSKPKEI
jgi:acyl-CoA reductase-like NAD-dependent aldehyde dehydrogenase